MFYIKLLEAWIPWINSYYLTNKLTIVVLFEPARFGFIPNFVDL